MPVFVWKGRTMAGESQAGELTFERQEDAVDFLRKKRIMVTSLKEKSKGFKFTMPGAGSVSTKEMAIFTRQFATMISAGLPLVQCLDILAAQTSNPAFARVIADVTREVEAGSTLADALGKHKKTFDDLFRNMIQAGEAGGILDDILLRLAQYIEKADALKRKIQGAMIYPAVVLCVALGATAFMLIFIIPTFAKMFMDFGGELPLPTKIVMGLSNFLRGYWYILLGIVGAVAFGIKRFYATEAGKMKIDRFLLRVPVLGSVIRKAAIARFTRTLGTLVSSGVPILSGLDITARTAGNKVVEKAIYATRESISQGDTIAEPLRQSGVFPPMVTQMIGVGEQTGALDEMLDKIANFYDDEVDTAVEQLTSIIEPVMIVVMGVIVGGMLISMYLPMFKLINVISGA